MRGRLAATLLIFAAWDARADHAQGPWERVSDDEGIVVDRREAPGSALKEFRGRALIDAPIARLLAVLDDVARRTEWMSRNVESRLLERESGRDVVYLRTDAPWPVADRDMVIEGRLIADPAGHAIRIELRGVAHPKEPPRAQTVRITSLRGHWLLVSDRGGAATRVEYQVFADPGGSLPAWLSNLASKRLPRDTLAGLRRQVKRASYPERERELVESPDLRAVLALEPELAR